MTANIFVLDTETTGLGGAAEGDVVVEIGIARVDLDRNRVYPEMGRIVMQQLTPEQRRSWVFEHTDLDPDEVERSPWSVGDVRAELAGYEGKVFTGYNTDFDFGRFLGSGPWDFRPRMAPCIMIECADRFNGGCWMKAQDAYDMLCPGNPAGVPGGMEEHRALSDAVLEGYILLGLCGRDPDIRGRYVRAAEGSE